MTTAVLQEGAPGSDLLVNAEMRNLSLKELPLEHSVLGLLDSYVT